MFDATAISLQAAVPALPGALPQIAGNAADGGAIAAGALNFGDVLAQQRIDRTMTAEGGNTADAAGTGVAEAVPTGALLPESGKILPGPAMPVAVSDDEVAERSLAALMPTAGQAMMAMAPRIVAASRSAPHAAPTDEGLPPAASPSASAAESERAEPAEARLAAILAAPVRQANHAQPRAAARRDAPLARSETPMAGDALPASGETSDAEELPSVPNGPMRADAAPAALAALPLAAVAEPMAAAPRAPTEPTTPDAPGSPVARAPASMQPQLRPSPVPADQPKALPAALVAGMARIEIELAPADAMAQAPAAMADLADRAALPPALPLPAARAPTLAPTIALAARQALPQEVVPGRAPALLADTASALPSAASPQTGMEGPQPQAALRLHPVQGAVRSASEPAENPVAQPGTQACGQPGRLAAETLTPAESASQPQAVMAQTPLPVEPAVTLPPSAHSTVRAERIDFATLVETLARAREEASPRPLSIAVTNTDFGRVSLRFETGADALSVTMSSADPGFVRAVNASAEAAAAQADNRGQPSSSETRSQQQAAMQASADGHGQRQPQAQIGRDDGRAPPQAAPSVRRDDSAPAARASAPQAGSQDGIYA